jgi:hypothetical protein
MSQVTFEQVADWMLSQLQAEGVLYQINALDGIEALFGTSYICENANGNLGVAPAVLEAFRQRTRDKVVWERGGQFWRWREEHDESSRQVG